MTPEAATDAFFTWESQLAALLPEPADRDDQVRWQWVRDHGRRVACQHDQRRSVPALVLETGATTTVH